VAVLWHGGAAVSHRVHAVADVFFEPGFAVFKSICVDMFRRPCLQTECRLGGNGGSEKGGGCE
jgi:hypothetical protein